MSHLNDYLQSDPYSSPDSEEIVGGEKDYSLDYEPSTTFGEGSLLEGDYFKGDIVVTEDPNIDLGVDGGSDGVTTLDDAGVTVNPDVEEATTALQEGGLDAFSQEILFDTTEPGAAREDLINTAQNTANDIAPDIAVGGGILALFVLAIIALISFAKGAGRGAVS